MELAHNLVDKESSSHPWVLVLEMMSTRVHAHSGQLHRDHVWVEVELSGSLSTSLLSASWLLVRALALPHGGELHYDAAAT